MPLEFGKNPEYLERTKLLGTQKEPHTKALDVLGIQTRILPPFPASLNTLFDLILLNCLQRYGDTLSALNVNDTS